MRGCWSTSPTAYPSRGLDTWSSAPGSEWQAHKGSVTQISWAHPEFGHGPRWVAIFGDFEAACLRIIQEELKPHLGSQELNAAP